MRHVVFAIIIVTGTIIAQVKSPPPSAKYHVDIRYRIEADRDGRVRLFRAMMAELNALGFAADPREDADLDILDPNADRLTGTISSDKLEQLQKVLNVQTVLARPVDLTLPEDLKKPVQISLKLANGLDATTQRLLHEQVISQLEKLGFANAVGYDDHGFTRVRGAIPSGQVMNLLKDLRGLPAGWLLQATPRSRLPQPLASVLPIRLITVLPDLEAVSAAVVPPAASPKYASDLRVALANPAFTGKPMRIEAALSEPIGDQKAFRFHLKSAIPGTLLEGIVGPLVTFYVANVKDLEKLAAFPEVLALRLPPMATNTVKPKTAAGDALAATHIRELQSRGYRGQGRKIIVIAGGFDLAVMPKNASYLDLTVELSPTLEPAPANPAFDGTAAALAARRAAPDAALVLVRIDPSAFHELETVAKATLGDLTLSPAQVARAEVLLGAYDELSRRRDYVTREYTEAFSNLSDDEKPRTRREKAQADLAKLKVEEATFRVSYDKLDALRKGIESLRGATAIVNTLTWDDGYPTDGLSEFRGSWTKSSCRSLGETAPASTVPSWVQAASESTWSVWAGPVLDRDGNRVMEFADANVPLPAGTFTREINFLANLASDGDATADFAAGAKLRIAIQWREPHDPNSVLTAEPLIGFTLQLMRQYDPSGKTTATDEFALIAQSQGQPVRLMRTPSAGVYEQSLDVTLPSAGRYALRVVMKPATENQFAAATRLAEISPKITLRNMADTKSRPIFATFVSAQGGVGIPADAARAFTVGRCDAQGRSLSLLGAGPGVQLRQKPDALLFGDGSGGAAATVAGLAACLADLGARPANLVGTTAIGPNGMLSLPVDWIQSLPAR